MWYFDKQHCFYTYTKNAKCYVHLAPKKKIYLTRITDRNMIVKLTAEITHQVQNAFKTNA